jgi:hypothetical protein
MNEIKILEVIGTPNAILHRHGLLVFEKSAFFLSANEQFTLSFEGLKNITSGFCNASVGKLVTAFGDKLGRLMVIKGLDHKLDWMEKIEEAIQLAKDPARMKRQNDAIAELFER